MEQLEQYKIVLPFEGEEEEKELRRVVESVEGVEFVTGNIRNLNGAMNGEIFGQIVTLIQVAAAMATLSDVFLNKRATITGKNNKVIRRNIKIRDLLSFFQKMK